VDDEEKAFYFGCLHGVGHGFYLPDGSSATYKKGPPTPWGYDVESLPPKSSGQQGAAAVHHKDGWTALAVHDYTVDSRPGSKSVFCFAADLALDELLFSVGEFFDAIQQRVGEITVVEYEGELVARG
jgi:hypothetical protein